MTISKSLKKSYLAPILPLLMLFAGWLFINSSLFTGDSTLSLGITIDMVILGPVLYFLMIRKTSVPNITIVPVFAFSILIASLILPSQNQQVLNLIKTWIVPIVELSVIGVITYNVILIRKEFKNSSNEEKFDFYDSFSNAAQKILPSKVAAVLAAEISTFYYGLFSWKRRELREGEYSYHKESSGIAILALVIFLVPVETVIFHFLISKWNSLAAWIFTGIGIYSGFQVLGILRSIPKRPILLNENTLTLRYGIFRQASLDISNIEEIELTERDIEEEDKIFKFSLLGNLESHNVIIGLKKDIHIEGLWGLNKKAKNIALHIDQPKAFKERLSHLEEA